MRSDDANTRNLHSALHSSRPEKDTAFCFVTCSFRLHRGEEQIIISMQLKYS